MHFPADKGERTALVAELQRRARESRDPDAAFHLGRYNLRGSSQAHFDAADGCFLKAVDFGGASWAWRTVDAYRFRNVTERTGQWMSRAMELEFPLPTAPGIFVSRDMFQVIGNEEGISSFHVSLMVDSDQPDEATRALNTAAKRLALVNELGQAYESSEEYGQRLAGPNPPRNAAGHEPFTPTWVSDAFAHRDGPYLLMDTKDMMWGPMARTMLLIVIEELSKVGITRARIAPAFGPLAELSTSWDQSRET